MKSDLSKDRFSAKPGLSRDYALTLVLSSFPGRMGKGTFSVIPEWYN
jgi:hypothetical protein